MPYLQNHGDDEDIMTGPVFVDAGVKKEPGVWEEIFTSVLVFAQAKI